MEKKVIYSRTNREDGLSVTVTETDRGFRVSFVDTDSGFVIETRVYPQREAAIEFAKTLIV